MVAVPSLASVAVLAGAPPASVSRPNPARKVTVPAPGAPDALTARARITTGVPSLRTVVVDGRSVREAVGPLPLLEPEQAKRPASAAAPTMRVEPRRTSTCPPTRRVAGDVPLAHSQAAPGGVKSFAKLLVNRAVSRVAQMYGRCDAMADGRPMYCGLMQSEGIA